MFRHICLSKLPRSRDLSEVKKKSIDVVIDGELQKVVTFEEVPNSEISKSIPHPEDSSVQAMLDAGVPLNAIDCSSLLSSMSNPTQAVLEAQFETLKSE